MSTSEQQAVIAPITITGSAISQIKRLMQENDVPEGYGLRVGIKGGGCSGFSYVLGFDMKSETDQVFAIDGVEVLMDRAHSLYLIGMAIDWHEGLNNRGFVFENPNATSTCGCGSSFTA